MHDHTMDDRIKDLITLFVSYGDLFRVDPFVNGHISNVYVSSWNQATLLGVSIGQFLKHLADLPGNILNIIIPHFHNMKYRYTRFDAAISSDSKNRAKTLIPEIEFLQNNRERGMILTRALTSKAIPERICHNNTKMNDRLLSQNQDNVLCVTDLDMVMPGTVLFDVGDLLQTVANRVPENEGDLSRVHFDQAKYRAILRGYLLETASFLTTGEGALLEEAERSMTQIMVLRFLTDYLEGDPYYRIAYKDHNLDRARNQIALIRFMDTPWAAIAEITKEERGRI